jgi:hypothetical protein
LFGEELDSPPPPHKQPRVARCLKEISDEAHAAGIAEQHSLRPRRATRK